MRVLAPRIVLLLIAAGAVALVFTFSRPGLPRPEIWRGHTKAVDAIAWSPDGRFIASGGWDHSVRLWDATTGTPIQSLSGIRSHVIDLAFSPDSRLLAAGTHDHSVHVWEIPSGTSLNWPKVHKGYITTLEFSPDGTMLATGSHEKLVILWDVKTRKPLWKLWGFKHWVGAATFSPDNRALAVGDYDGVRFYDVETGNIKATVRMHLVHWLDYSPDGQLLVAGGSYGAVKILDTSTLAVRTSLPARQVTSIAFSPNGRTLATGGGVQLNLWNPTTGKLRETLSGSTASSYPDWMLRILPFLRPQKGPPIRAIAYSPDGSEIAAGCPDNLIRVWRSLSH